MGICFEACTGYKCNINDRKSRKNSKNNKNVIKNNMKKKENKKEINYIKSEINSNDKRETINLSKEFILEDIKDNVNLQKDNKLEEKIKVNNSQKDDNIVKKENINSSLNNTIENKTKNNNLSEENISEENSEIKNLKNICENKENINLKNEYESQDNKFKIDIKSEKEIIINNIINNKQTEYNIKNNFEINNLYNENESKNKTNKINNDNESIEVNSNNKIPNENLNKIVIDNIDYDTFPRDTKYEEELNLNFKYFNVFWYDPNKTKECDKYTKCFENVQFQIEDDLFSAINFFKSQTIVEWIVVTPGSQGEELILNLGNFNCIKSFFIYCRNTKYHEWANKTKKVGCLTSDPVVLCQKFIELNKNYIIPEFNYETKDDIFSLSEDLVKKNSPLKKLIEINNFERNKYNIFCIKMLNYLNSDEILIDITEENLFRITIPDKFEGLERQILQASINNLKEITLISLYFSKYPYIFNIITLEEIQDILKVEMNPQLIIKYENNTYPILIRLYDKIMKNESIIDDKEDLKQIQIALIYKLYYGLIIEKKLPIKLFFEKIQVFNFLRDIDFSLKLFCTIMYTTINNKKNNCFNDIDFCLTFGEPRYKLYTIYLNSSTDKLSEQEKIRINKSLVIKDFIIVGDNIIHEKYKILEKDIEFDSFKYLNIGQLSNYLKERKKENTKKIRKYFYFLLIKFTEFQKNFENLALESIKLGFTFIAFLLIDKEDNIKIPKNHINSIIIPTILIYSPQDIINYFSQEFILFNSIEAPEINEIGEALNIKIPKITFEQNDEDNYKDGCFELAETFDVNLIRNKFMLKFSYSIDFIWEFSKNIYYIYKDHNALDIFYNQNCPYFGWKLYPELSFEPNICFAKRILYMYCREEKPSNHSFYRIINDDLRSRDPSKIYKYLSILALINQLIEERGFASFKGKVFRATKLDENLIMKLVPETKMVNTTFWSTSKDFKKAEKFMKKDNWRNCYIICEAIKHNIDIDLEELNTFDEKEVLFLPFTEFIVKKVSSQIKYEKKIFIIELIELGNRNFVNSDNMQVENINSLGTNNALNNYLKIKGNEVKNFIKNFGFE